jgi:hypothetical protein
MKKFSNFKFKYNRINEQENILRPKLQLPVSDIDVEQQDEKSDVAKFISKLFEAREMAHVFHLMVNGEMGSHATHTALGEFYESLIGFIDELTEVYQGQYGLIENYDIIDTSSARERQYIQYFENLVNSIKQNRSSFSTEDTHLHNLIDEIVAITYRLLYKLKFNK